jgi:hypothetical protein
MVVPEIRGRQEALTSSSDQFPRVLGAGERPLGVASACDDFDRKFGPAAGQPIVARQEPFKANGAVEPGYEGVAAGYGKSPGNRSAVG